jgi:WD40 repeat protein
VFFCEPKKPVREWSAPSSVLGLSFAPKGCRLAMAHYQGVTLWYPNLEKEPQSLAWKGSHIGVTWSPDAKFVISAMQENALHGWRIDGTPGHMRMTGYPAKTRSLSWTKDAKALATSGAEAVILWSFASKDGPAGKPPRECGVRAAKVTQVACHPVSDLMAAGYEDGSILLIRLQDGAELWVQPPGQAAITALAWDHKGQNLAFGGADGRGGVLPLP